MVEKDKKLADDARVKFLEALEKKKEQSRSGAGVGPLSGTKVGGAPTKPLQRKSGPA